MSRLDEAQARLEALGLKQGRVARYTSKAERDKFLKKEIASIEAYEKTQMQTTEDARADLAAAQNRLQEMERKGEEVLQNLDDRRERLRALGEHVAGLKEENSKLTEHRK